MPGVVAPLLLLDITMPGMNGLEVCRAIRADEKLADLPIIFMTARAQASDVTAGMEAGADTYIIKPFGPIELREHVEAMLGQRGRAPESSGGGARERRRCPRPEQGQPDR